MRTVQLPGPPVMLPVPRSSLSPARPCPSRLRLLMRPVQLAAAPVILPVPRSSPRPPVVPAPLA